MTNQLILYDYSIILHMCCVYPPVYRLVRLTACRCCWIRKRSTTPFISRQTSPSEPHKLIACSPGFRSRSRQGFGAGVARDRSIWLEPESEPSLWAGSDSGSSFNFSFTIHANCKVHNLFLYLSGVKNNLVP